jgi:hypothetical protein
MPMQSLVNWHPRPAPLTLLTLQQSLAEVNSTSSQNRVRYDRASVPAVTADESGSPPTICSKNYLLLIL